MEINMKKKASKIYLFLFLLMVLIICLVPMLWMILSSLKTKKELIQKPWAMPAQIQWGNYVKAWEKANFPALIKNSIVITGFSVLLMLIFAAMIAFAITRYKLKVGKITLMYILIGQTISMGMIIFPVVILLRKLNLDVGHLGLILTYTAAGLPFAVFVMQGFFSGIPNELYESAEIDGASEPILFSRIAVPLAKPSIAAVMLFQFLWVWNEFVLAFTVIREQTDRTIIVGLYSVVNGVLSTDYVTAFAGTVIVCIPIIVIYLIFQKYLIQGLVAGAVKG